MRTTCIFCPFASLHFWTASVSDYFFLTCVLDPIYCVRSPLHTNSCSNFLFSTKRMSGPGRNRQERASMLSASFFYDSCMYPEVPCVCSAACRRRAPVKDVWLLLITKRQATGVNALPYTPPFRPWLYSDKIQDIARIDPSLTWLQRPTFSIVIMSDGSGAP